MTNWGEHIHLTDVWEGYADDTLTFEQARDETVKRLRASRWGGAYEEGGGRSLPRADVTEQIDMLELQDDVEGFDYEFAGLLKLADRDHVWIERQALSDQNPRVPLANEQSV